MSKLLYTLCLTFLLLGTVNAQSLNYEKKNLNGDWVIIEDLQGKSLTVIDFWATWCKPCIKALPKIDMLSDKFKSEGVGFIGVNVDGPRNESKVKPLIKSLDISYPILLDPDKEVQEDLNISSLPTLLILNSDGTEIYRHEGFNTGDEEHLESKIKELLTK